MKQQLLKKKKLSQKNKKGFTLVEILLVIGIISLISGISIPVYQSFQTKNNLDVAVDNAVQALRRAQMLSQAVNGDSNWGVKFQSGSMVLFKGASYATRDANYDEIFDLPTTIVASNLTEIVFAKFTGFPTATGTTTLTTINNDSDQIIINEKGTLTY
ncbi:MAG: hypothetical protein ACD_11C00108G0010 [uncultured bacterium]|nr:MAG: hypothetical protein ACD_11C00108G0010 [uncultured bacterium]